MKLDRDELMFLWSALEEYEADYQDPTAELNTIRKAGLMERIERELEALDGN